MPDHMILVDYPNTFGFEISVTTTLESGIQASSKVINPPLNMSLDQLLREKVEDDVT